MPLNSSLLGPQADTDPVRNLCKGTEANLCGTFAHSRPCAQAVRRSWCATTPAETVPQLGCLVVSSGACGDSCTPPFPSNCRFPTIHLHCFWLLCSRVAAALRRNTSRGLHSVTHFPQSFIQQPKVKVVLGCPGTGSPCSTSGGCQPLWRMTASGLGIRSN